MDMADKSSYTRDWLLKSAYMSIIVLVLSACSSGSDEEREPVVQEPSDSPQLIVEAMPGSVDVSWQQQEGTHYNLFHYTNSDCDLENYTSCQQAHMHAGVSSPTKIQLENGQTYRFRLEAVNDAGSVLSREVSSRPDIYVIHYASAPHIPGYRGRVNDMTVDDEGFVYIGGHFTEIATRTGQAVLLHRDTGELDSFPVVDGSVDAIVSDDKGGWYLGGNFTSVGGKARHGLAHIRSDGHVSDWNPGLSGANSTVRAMVKHQGKLFIGGEFFRVAGQERLRLAAFNEEGQLLDWSPKVDGSVWAMAAGEGVIYIGAAFISDGLLGFAAAFDMNANPTSWKPDITRAGVNFPTDSPHRKVVTSLAVDGQSVFMSGIFSYVNNEPRMGFAVLNKEGELQDLTLDIYMEDNNLLIKDGKLYAGGTYSGDKSENWHSSYDNYKEYPARVAVVDLNTHAIDIIELENSGWIGSLAVANEHIYAGGHFTNAAGEYSSLIAIGPEGDESFFGPYVGGAVTSLAASNQSIYAGGNLAGLNPEPRSYLAKLTPDGRLDSWQMDIDGAIEALKLADNTLYLGGSFNHINGEKRTALGSVYVNGEVTNWNPVSSGQINTLSIVDATLYAGGNFILAESDNRRGLAAFDANDLLINWATDSDASWNSIEFSSVCDVVIKDDIVYVKEFFTVFGVSGSLLRAIDLTEQDQLWEVYFHGAGCSLADGNGRLYVGGAFHDIDGVEQKYIAAVNYDGTLVDWQPELPGRVTALEVFGNRLYAGWERQVDGRWSGGLAILEGQNVLEENILGHNGSVNSLTATESHLLTGGYFIEVKDHHPILSSTAESK